MTENQRRWADARDSLGAVLADLGYPFELADEISRYLGSPKAIDRMKAYVRGVRPDSLELIVDEMLAIRYEIDEWRKKKSAQEANMRYNEIMYLGLDPDDPYDDMEED